MPHGITQCYLPPGRGDIPAVGKELSSPLIAPSMPSFTVLPRRKTAPLNPAGEHCKLPLRDGQSPDANRFLCILSQISRSIVTTCQSNIVQYNK